MSGPSKIMLIRHGEKPAEPPPPYGITLQGEHDNESLTAHGWQRAGALVSFFAPSNGQFQNPHIATPRTIYAVRVGPDSESWRHQQTVTPLLEKLHGRAAANFDYLKHQTDLLVASVLASEGVVLVCWDHNHLPVIARQIPSSPNSTTLPPDEWDESRFDLVWVFDLDPIAGGYLFKAVPQLVLAGDAPA